MFQVMLRDMQWRARRIVLGLSATALVLAMAALLGALHGAFLDETDRTVAMFGADRWIVPRDTAGPFTSNTPLRTELVDAVAAEPGVQRATPVAIFRHVVTGATDRYSDVNVVAYAPGGVVNPRVVTGRAPASAGEAAVDERLAVPIGARLHLAGHALRVVGLVRGLTYNGGTPTVLVTLADGQNIAFDDGGLASAIVVRGVPESLPKGLAAMTPTQVRDDLRRPLSVATNALALVAGLLWVVAAGIVGMLAYLSGLDRRRDLAVFKAVGVSTRTLLAGLVLQGMVVTTASALLAIGLAWALAPAFPVAITLGVSDALRLLGVALLVGVTASAASVRGAVRVDPVEAFAGG